MSIQTDLERLYDSLKGCQMAAFGDLSSGLILRSHSAKPWPRERLDQLCESAVRCFEICAQPHTSNPGDTAEGCQTAVLFTAERAFVFARREAEPSDVTCAVFNRTTAIGTAVARVKGTALCIGSDSG
ncbi:MAG: hypothetical protein AAF636_12635 [Pseudomonadota bacterium]